MATIDGSQKRARRAVIYGTLVAAALLLLFGAVRGSIALASRVLERRYPPPGQMVSVDGHKLMLYCTGEGSPTVVIETGLGIGWEGWQSVSLPLAKLSRVCVYDRAGYGWSEPGPKPRTALQSALELHGLLTNAGVAGPYVLVAHSFGGYIARVYASRFRDSLSGIVMVDPSHEDELRATNWAQADPSLRLEPRWYRLALYQAHRLFPLSGLRRLLHLYQGEKGLPSELRSLPLSVQRRILIASSLTQLETEREEYTSLPESEAEAHTAPFPRDLRLTVITARYRPSPSDLRWPLVALPATHRELQSKLAQQSSLGKQIFADNSGHSVQLDQPELIIDAVRDMVEESRGHEAIPH
ncbi:MAG TPA: alpha/beta hydrolase [Terriglobia bacterium]|nr:alpha/beta hydrolase [Terriglobia bacterium]